MPSNDETYADVFIEYMNFYDFDQEDMINPDDKVEYHLYLKNVERTISEKLEFEINIFGDPKIPMMKNPNLTLVQ